MVFCVLMCPGPTICTHLVVSRTWTNFSDRAFQCNCMDLESGTICRRTSDSRTCHTAVQTVAKDILICAVWIFHLTALLKIILLTYLLMSDIVVYIVVVELRCARIGPLQGLKLRMTLKTSRTRPEGQSWQRCRRQWHRDLIRPRSTSLGDRQMSVKPTTHLLPRRLATVVAVARSSHPADITTSRVRVLLVCRLSTRSAWQCDNYNL